jgi:Flp pilus assembly protein TadC
MIWLLPLCGALLVFYFTMVILGKTDNRKNRLRERLSGIDHIGRRRAGVVDEMSLPFWERFLKPIVDRMVKGIASVLPMNRSFQQKLTEQLTQAGIRRQARDYAAMNLLIIFLLTALGGYLGFALGKSTFQILLFAFGGFYTGYTLRRFSLTRTITARKNALQVQLPEALDLLSVSVSAGLGFDQALAYVVEKGEGPLIDEFYIAQQEISMGRPRRDALKQFADRCNLEEVKMFVSAVMQADELGISMQNVLSAQAAMIRKAHKQHVEEAAMKIPVKILFPIVIFVFPVIFIVLLGPAIPSVMQALAGLT